MKYIIIIKDEYDTKILVKSVTLDSKSGEWHVNYTTDINRVLLIEDQRVLEIAVQAVKTVFYSKNYRINTTLI